MKRIDLERHGRDTARIARQRALPALTVLLLLTALAGAAPPPTPLRGILTPLARTPPPTPLRGVLAPLGRKPPRARQAWRTFTWAQLEPRRGRYDFSPVEDALEQARQGGAQLAFRLACVNVGRSASGVDVPPYLAESLPRGFRFDDRVLEPRAPAQGHLVYVPDWNDPDFLDRARRLVSALGARYDGDPRLAWLEVGLYGNRGDWSVRDIPYPARTGAESATPATLRGLFQTQADAFPRTRLIAPTEAFEAGLAESAKVGARAEGLGRPGFGVGVPADRWRTAPIVADVGALDAAGRRLARHQIRERHVAMVAGDPAAVRALAPATGYLFALDRADVPPLRAGGAFIIHERWSNAGVTPAYNPWQVLFELRRGPGDPPVWIGHSLLDLQTFFPGPRALREMFRLPDKVRPGRYHLVVVVADPAGYRAPLALAGRRRGGDGSYALGEVRVRR